MNSTVITILIVSVAALLFAAAAWIAVQAKAKWDDNLWHNRFMDQMDAEAWEITEEEGEE